MHLVADVGVSSLLMGCPVSSPGHSNERLAGMIDSISETRHDDIMGVDVESGGIGAELSWRALQR
jgi:hypothetical protein